MKLKHVLFDSNSLTGGIPRTLTLVSTVEVVHFDRNQLSGPVPSNLIDLKSLSELYLSHNGLNGSLPDLTGLNSLTYVDLSNNNFNSSDIPLWVSSLPELTTVILKDNRLSGTLNLTNSPSKSLQLINLENNLITDLEPRTDQFSFDLILIDNGICRENGASDLSCRKRKNRIVFCNSY